METESTKPTTITYDEFRALYNLHKRLGDILYDTESDGFTTNRKLIRQAFYTVSLAIDACQLAEDLVR